MRHVRAWQPFLLTLALGCGGSEATLPEKLDGVVVIDGLKSKVPAEWLQERPASKEFRLYQFRLPGSNGADATLVVYGGIGGTMRENVNRWKGMFSKVVGEVTQKPFDLEGRDAALLDIQGTFNESDMMNPQARPRLRPDYRMVAVHLDGKQGPFHIKLTGPAATVERHKQAFDEWLKGFK